MRSPAVISATVWGPMYLRGGGAAALCACATTARPEMTAAASGAERRRKTVCMRAFGMVGRRTGRTRLRRDRVRKLIDRCATRKDAGTEQASAPLVPFQLVSPNARRYGYALNHLARIVGTALGEIATRPPPQVHRPPERRQRHAKDRGRIGEPAERVGQTTSLIRTGDSAHEREPDRHEQEVDGHERTR